ncbi:hypothetical protein D623_10005157 [Myotis brandtii]|uniref:Uncharacterized protein n=1 Tax=Myotis brandtii TaxID=109478 RepID=S7MLB1_MYOBR|nr:hypothetical protein D623_10005157 [Myotis brandtii]
MVHRPLTVPLPLAGGFSLPADAVHWMGVPVQCVGPSSSAALGSAGAGLCSSGITVLCAHTFGSLTHYLICLILLVATQQGNEM